MSIIISTIVVAIILVVIGIVGYTVYRMNREPRNGYNEILKQIAEDEKVAYLPLFDKYTDCMKENLKTPGKPYDTSVNGMLKDVFKIYFLKTSLDKIAESNGFVLTSDSTHMNTKGGLIIADMIEKLLKK